jgi:hypothetical protein
MPTAVAEKPKAAAAPAASDTSQLTGATAADNDADATSPSPGRLLRHSSTLARLEAALEAAKLEAQTHRRRASVFGVAVLLLGAVLVAGHYGYAGEGSAARRAAMTQAQHRFEAAVKSAVDHTAVLSRLNVTLSELGQNIRSVLGDDDDELRVGQALRARGARPRRPVVVVPGFVTSGLELWEGRPCARSLFRQRLWGTLSMASTLLQNRTCWLDHLSLDPKTGGDPPGIRLRAAKGLEAVDDFMTGYWVFSKLFQSLGDVGYDNNFVVAASYDWRLSLPVLQRRDAYFTRLKTEVELLRKAAGGSEKVVLVSHSFGGVVIMTFFDWVERADKGWTERNVHAWANLAAPLLGLPKALAPLVSGESRETADLMQGVAFLVESYLSRSRRARLFRTWGSLQTMLPVGGAQVWGNATHAPDDPPELREAGRSLGALLLARDDRASAAGRLGASATAAAAAAEKEKGKGKKGKKKGAKDELAAPSEGGGDGSGSNELIELPLDVNAALRFVGRMAGPDFVANLPHWSGAARLLDLKATLREAQEEAAARAELLHEREEEREHGDGESCAWSGSGGAGGRGTCGSVPSSASQDPKKDKGSSLEDDDNIDVDKGSGRTPHGNSTQASAMSATAASLEAITRAINALLNYGDSAAAPAAPARDPDKADEAAANASAAAAPVPRDAPLDRAAAPGPAVRPIDPSVTPLPKAPSLRVYCMYGTGAPTERAYHGDGTVPLLSNGALCEGGWRTRRLNPSSSKVIVREYPNEPVPAWQDARGGPKASSHVEILGHEGLMEDVLRIATGFEEEQVTDRYHSRIREIAAAIPWKEL